MRLSDDESQSACMIDLDEGAENELHDDEEVSICDTEGYSLEQM